MVDQRINKPVIGAPTDQILRVDREDGEIAYLLAGGGVYRVVSDTEVIFHLPGDDMSRRRPSGGRFTFEGDAARYLATMLDNLWGVRLDGDYRTPKAGRADDD